MRKFFCLAFGCTIWTTVVAAEAVEGKFRGVVPLDTFKCEATKQSTLVNRVCYDADQNYMIIQLQGVYYHYCEIDPVTVGNLLSAGSLGRYYRAHIRGSDNDGRFDCRRQRVPEY